MNVSTNPKTSLYVGGLDESVNEAILHAAFIPFGDIKDVNIPLDQTTQKNRGFGFITYMEKPDASAAMDNMHNAELYGRVIRCNFAQPMKIKGGQQGWSHQPVWADADAYMENQVRCLFIPFHASALISELSSKQLVFNGVPEEN